MNVDEFHSWTVTPKEAIQLQKELANQLEFAPLGKKISYVAGADVSCTKNDPRLFAVVALFKFPEMELVECVSEINTATFPYISGLLSFREIPVLIRAFEKLKGTPDVVICDGQGVAHPRGIGLASHLGLLLDLPSVGCAKTLLVGTHDPLAEEQWSQKPLIYKDKIVGAALRTRTKINPVYVSCGHKITLEESVRIIKTCCGRYRIPEPTRRAHLLVNSIRRNKILLHKHF